MTSKPWPQEWCDNPVYIAVDNCSLDGDTTVKYQYCDGHINILDIVNHYPAPNRLFGAYVNSDGCAV